MSELRDKIRESIFTAKPKSEVFPFFGNDIEIRQPQLGVILGVRQDDQEAQITKMLTDYTYVPGTEEKVFSPEDAEALLTIPFGADMSMFTSKMNALLGVNPTEVKAGIEDTMKMAGPGTAALPDDGRLP